MKRGIVFLLIILVFISIPLVIAQEDNKTKEKLNIGEIDTFLDPEQSIAIPDYLKIPAQVIFGIKGEITLQVFIILIALWFILLLLIKDILEFTPFFNGEIIPWLASIVITTLVAISGAIRSMAIFFLNFGNLFGILEGKAGLAIFVALVIVIILGYGLNKLLKILRNSMELGKATQEGFSIRKFIEMIKVYNKTEL